MTQSATEQRMQLVRRANDKAITNTPGGIGERASVFFQSGYVCGYLEGYQDVLSHSQIIKNLESVEEWYPSPHDTPITQSVINNVRNNAKEILRQIRATGPEHSAGFSENGQAK